MEVLSHYGPALCVKFFNGYVYAGYGPFIQVYDYHTGDLKNQCRIFERNKVHGVTFSNSGMALCYGSKSMSLIPLGELSKRSSLVEYERRIGEWIISGEFNYDNNGFFLLTCYNRVLSFDLLGNVIGKSAVYGERSLLYSGSIKVLSSCRAYVNAGTVMGGIIIWDLFSKNIVANLLGHSGSIFYVTMNSDGTQVASCSDDRSVRLWDLKSQTELSVGWGHTARIWNLLFFNNGSRIISVSEDCTCRLWAVKDNKLLQRAIYEAHLSKNVWGVDVNEQDQIAITSGNDGRLKLIELQPVSDSQQVFTLKEISTQSCMVFDKEEIIKGFHWFAFGLIAITSMGKVLKFDDNEGHWEFVLQSELFTSYSVTNGITDANIVIFSNNKCDILILKLDPCDGRIIDRQEMHVNELSKTQNCMVCRHNSIRDCFLITLESPNPHDPFLCLKFDINTLQLENKYSFIKPVNFSSSCLEVYDSFLLVGSRFSTLAIFNFNNVEQEPYVFRRLTPGDTTTSIHFVEYSQNKHVFAVTNRDGYYIFIGAKLDSVESNGPLKCEVIHDNKVARGFLEGANFEESGDLITFGFKSELFYIYNESQCYEIASLVCGGAHRQWKFSRTPKGFILIFIRASSIYFAKIGESALPRTLRCGTHGREIRDISILKDRKYKNGYLFCTASEDTTIKLCHVESATGNISTFWTLRKHVSGLQRCKIINDKFMISSSAREELFLWQITTDCNTKPYVTLRQSLPIFCDNPDLRIMDFAVKFEETDAQGFLLATVYSDSAIKLWRFDYQESKFHLLLDGRYETCCLLHVSLFSLGDQLYIMITATNGCLVVYNITDLSNEGHMAPLPDVECSIRTHQSGIHAFDIAVDNAGDSVKAYTGGDDNGLGISYFHLDKSTNRLTPKIKDFQKSAASSTITSCKLLGGGTQLLTTSVDQVLRRWSVAGDKLALEEQKYTSIADTGSLDVVENLLVVGGVGLSVVKNEHH
ncbi:related to Regulator of Ty1 transposition protein 10 [Zygosaccharomyces bailii ISA1307]|nr:related to Regulator of Ty1 transposition protein 10 [Zygosaccharomyces bailii ISA1307]